MGMCTRSEKYTKTVLSKEIIIIIIENVKIVYFIERLHDLNNTNHLIKAFQIAYSFIYAYIFSDLKYLVRINDYR